MMTPATSTKPANRLTEETVILDVVFHMPGDSRQASTEKVETDADKSWLRLSQKLFKSEKFEKCKQIQREAYQWLRQRALPVGLEGYYVMPLAYVDEVDDHMDDVDSQLASVAEEFCEEYETLQDQARAELGDMFNSSKYPEVEYYRRGIWNERRWLEIGTPNASKIGSARSRKEREKSQKAWDEAVETVTCALRQEVATLVSHLTEQLTRPGENGKKRVLTESAVCKTVEWLELFSKRNVLGDAELAEMVEQAKGVLEGVDVKDLRNDGKFRADIGQQMVEVKERLDSLLANAPSRKISFDD